MPRVFRRRRQQREPSALRSVRSFVLGLVIATCAVTLCLCLALAVSEHVRPAVLARPGRTSAVDLEALEYDDAATVSLTLTQDEEPTLTSPAAGRLTAFTCAAGQQLASGESIGSVDGMPITALATAIPLYRDLTDADTGEDVRALQQALTDLGYPVRPDGQVGEYTRRLVTRLLDGPRATTLDVIPASRFLWLSASQVEVAQCLAHVGEHVETTTPLLRTPSTVSAAHLSGLPAQPAPGDRLLTVPGIDSPLALGQARDIPADLLDSLGSADLSEAEPASTSRSGTASGESEGKNTQSLQVRWTLATPLTVVSVPPSALYRLNEGQACLQSPQGEVYPVTLVGSQLGTSLVVLDTSASRQTTLPAQATLSPDDTLACR